MQQVDVMQENAEDIMMWNLLVSSSITGSALLNINGF